MCEALSRQINCQGKQDRVGEVKMGGEVWNGEAMGQEEDGLTPGRDRFSGSSHHQLLASFMDPIP